MIFTSKENSTFHLIWFVYKWTFDWNPENMLLLTKHVSVRNPENLA